MIGLSEERGHPKISCSQNGWFLKDRIREQMVPFVATFFKKFFACKGHP